MSRTAGRRASSVLTNALPRAVALFWLAPLFSTSPTMALDAPAPHKARRAQPATASRSSPETTGSLAPLSAKTPAGKSPSSLLASLPDPGAADESPLPPPFNLPTASRARMRACGERWREMKLDGEAGDEIWRDFATKCLTAKNDPVARIAGTQPQSEKPKAAASARPVAPDAQSR